MLSDELACSSLVMRIAERGDLVKTKTKRDKVVAEITATHLMKLMQEQGRFLDQQQAVAFFNEGDRAYVMWKQMMYAGENYIKSVLAQTPRPKPICRTPALRPELEASQMSR